MAKYSLDMTVLRMLKDRAKYERFAKLVPDGVVNRETKVIIDRMGQFFEATEVQRITHEKFWPFLRTRYAGKWSEKDADFWHGLTKPIDLDNDPGMDEQIITNLLSGKLGIRVLEAVEKWKDGEEIELGETIRAEVEDYEEALTRKVRTPVVELGWEDMLEEEQNETGLSWRIKALRDSTRPLRGGDFGIVAMRPDRGKTTLVASEVTHFAPQLRDLFTEKRPVVWLNNEGPGRRIMSRIRQSALNMSLSEIVALGPKEAQKRYIEAIGGEEDMIRVLDIHGFKHYEVEELIRKHRPGVVVFDMIDNISFAGQTLNNGERTDQLLESMYQWARSQGVIHDFVGIATSQVSADGEGERFPAQSQLKDSKTGKQGACDFIITGGFDRNLPNMRFIGMTKNKIKREGAKYSPDATYHFDADRGRLIEPTEVDE